MTEIQIHIFILSVLSLLFLGLTFLVFRTYQPSSGIRYYGLFLLGISALAALNALYISEPFRDHAMTITRFGYVVGAFTFAMFFMFSLYFIVPSNFPPGDRRFYWIIPLVFLFPYIIFNDQFIKATIIENGLPKDIFGPTYWVFPVIIVFYFLFSAAVLFGKARRAIGEQRNDATKILVAFILTAGAGALLDVVLPLFDIRAAHYIGVETSILIGGTTFFIVRKK